MIIKTGSLKVYKHFKDKISQSICADKTQPCINVAIYNENIEVFKIVKELGANLKYFDNDQEIPTYLCLCCLMGKTKILKILLQEIPEMID